MKKSLVSIIVSSSIGVLALLLCLALPVRDSLAAPSSGTPLELSVNIVGQRDGGNGAIVGVAVRSGAVLQSRDNLQLHFSTNRDAYVYVLMFDSYGQAQQLFPDPKRKSDAKMKGKAEHIIPAENQWFWLDENTGGETIAVLASLTPLNDIRTLLGGMEGADKAKSKEISRKVWQRVRSLLGATKGVAEGPPKSFRLGDGRTVAVPTDTAKGSGSAVVTVTFAHIDNKAVGSARAGAGVTRGAAGGLEAASGSEGTMPKGIETALAGFLDRTGSAAGIARIMEKIGGNGALEETRGIGGIQIYKQLSPAVVLVATEEGQGSGSVIDKKGTVITNWHVVRDCDRVVVFFKPTSNRALTRKDAYAARVVKVDEVSDLALLEIERPPATMAVAKLGSMKGVAVGQEVHAIGHPEGEIWTYTKGTISQIRPAYKWSYEDGSEHNASVIQTQTPINPGNSGGPLLDENGEIIGVNSFNKEGEGLNFAVSVNTVRAFLQAKKSRVVEKTPAPGWLGNAKLYNVHKNESGMVDVIGVDTQRNGTIDFYIIRNPDGSPKYVEFLRPDGTVELRIYDTDRNGTWKTYAFYNEKGKPYLIGISDRGDGKISRYAEP